MYCVPRVNARSVCTHLLPLQLRVNVVALVFLVILQCLLCPIGEALDGVVVLVMQAEVFLEVNEKKYVINNWMLEKAVLCFYLTTVNVYVCVREWVRVRV